MDDDEQCRFDSVSALLVMVGVALALLSFIGVLDLDKRVAALEHPEAK